MIPKTREQFIQFCLRQLGHPVIQIELDYEQLDDIVDYCLHYYYDYHFDGTHKEYLAHKLTKEDIESGFVKLDDSIIFVTDLYMLDMNRSSNNFFDVQYQIALNDFFNISSTQMHNYWISMTHLELINQIINPRTAIRFNRHMNKLFIDGGMRQKLTAGSYVVIECYRAINPDEYPDIWGDRWLQRYTTAHIKKVWGEVLKKFNLTLPGNVTYNGQIIYDEAINEIRELEEKMINSYSGPVLDMIG